MIACGLMGFGCESIGHAQGLGSPIEADRFFPSFLKGSADRSMVGCSDRSFAQRDGWPQATCIAHEEDFGGIVQFFEMDIAVFDIHTDASEELFDVSQRGSLDDIFASWGKDSAGFIDDEQICSGAVRDHATAGAQQAQAVFGSPFSFSIGEKVVQSAARFDI